MKQEVIFSVKPIFMDTSDTLKDYDSKKFDSQQLLALVVYTMNTSVSGDSVTLNQRDIWLTIKPTLRETANWNASPTIQLKDAIAVHSICQVEFF